MWKITQRAHNSSVKLLEDFEVIFRLSIFLKKKSDFYTGFFLESLFPSQETPFLTITFLLFSALVIGLIFRNFEI